jgi:hypothetical protein
LNYDLIYYSTFNQLKKIIVDNENWSEFFQKDFGRPDGIISRLHELDSIRITLAHNRMLSDFDFRSFKMLFEQIMSCLPEGEAFLKDLNLEITQITEQQRKNVQFQGIAEITKLGIDNALFTSVYRVVDSMATDIYHDAKLSDFTVQILPYESRINIYLDFYSKWANRNCKFRYFCDSKKIEHITPDVKTRLECDKIVFKELPWKKSPNWRQVIRRTYAKIGPLHVTDKTIYYLFAYPQEDIYWIIRYIDGFNGNEYSFKWDGKGLDEKNIIQQS